MVLVKESFVLDPDDVVVPNASCCDYSMLEEKDRHGDLEKVPDSAFPKLGEMPVIPGSEDGERIVRPDPDDLPTTDTPDDIPRGKTTAPGNQ